MKKLTIFALLLACVVAQAQVSVDDFESGSKGWVAVEGTCTLRANEFKTGINLSNNVLYTQRDVASNNWAGALLNDCSHTGYKYVHAYMYRSNANVPNLKIYDSEPAVELEPMNTIVANQWQDVVFDISAYADRGTDFLFFMVDRTEITEAAWMLIDEVQLSNDATPRTEVVGGNTPTPDPYGEYTLVWNEDFTDGALDQGVWNVEVNGDGGGNNELQYYCEKGVSVGTEPTTGKKCLILKATKENYNGKGCTSGRVNTNGKMSYTFGRIDARIKFPYTANGLWPAFWQLGSNIDEVGWPRCGETDIIELGHSDGYNGRQSRYFNGAMHVGSAWNTVWQDVNSVEWSYDIEGSFHTLTMIWTPTSIDMYMDKDEHPELAAYFHADLESNSNADYNRQLVFGKPNFLVANLAVGGNFPGIYDVNNITALADGPRYMYIDWIRIYQRGDANQSFSCPSPSDAIEPEIPQGIEMSREPDTKSQKLIQNGQLLIRRGGKTYTLDGRLIR